MPVPVASSRRRPSQKLARKRCRPTRPAENPRGVKQQTHYTREAFRTRRVTHKKPVTLDDRGPLVGAVLLIYALGICSLPSCEWITKTKRRSRGGRRWEHTREAALARDGKTRRLQKVARRPREVGKSPSAFYVQRLPEKNRRRTRQRRPRQPGKKQQERRWPIRGKTPRIRRAFVRRKRGKIPAITTAYIRYTYGELVRR